MSTATTICLETLGFIPPEPTSDVDTKSYWTSLYLGHIEDRRSPFKDDPPTEFRPSLEGATLISLVDQKGRDLLQFLPKIEVIDRPRTEEFKPTTNQVLFDIKSLTQNPIKFNLFLHEYGHLLDPQSWLFFREVEDARLASNSSENYQDKFLNTLIRRSKIIQREARAWHYAKYLTDFYGLTDLAYTEHCFNTHLYHQIDVFTWNIMSWYGHLDFDQEFYFPIDIHLNERRFSIRNFNAWAVRVLKVSERLAQENQTADLYHSDHRFRLRLHLASIN